VILCFYGGKGWTVEGNEAKKVFIKTDVLGGPNWGRVHTDCTSSGLLPPVPFCLPPHCPQDKNNDSTHDCGAVLI